MTLSLSFDHALCVVDDLELAAARAVEAGWVLDPGSVHDGPGTRNRRLVLGSHYLELLDLALREEAAANRLRLDRRADWPTTGASPFGIGLRGQLPARDRADFWLYDELGVRIWVHDDNENALHRPLEFVLELSADQLQARAQRAAAAQAPPNQATAELRAIRISSPLPARVPTYSGPAITHAPGGAHMHLDIGPGPTHAITEILTITARTPASQA